MNLLFLWKIKKIFNKNLTHFLIQKLKDNYYYFDC